MSSSKLSFLDNPNNFSLIFGNQQPVCKYNCFPHKLDSLRSCKIECLFPLHDTKVGNNHLTGISTIINKLFFHKKKPLKPYFIIGFGPPASGKSGIIPFLERHQSLFKFGINAHNTVEINVDKIFQETHQWNIEKKNLEKKRTSYYQELELDYQSKSFQQSKVNHLVNSLNFSDSEKKIAQKHYSEINNDSQLSSKKKWELFFEHLRKVKHQSNVGKLYSTYRYFCDQISDIMLYKSAAFRYNIYWETTGFSNNWTEHIIDEMKLFDYQVIVVYPFVSTPKILTRLRLRAQQEGQPPREETGVLLNVHNTLRNFLLLKHPDHFLFLDNNGHKENEKILFHLHDDSLPTTKKEQQITYHLRKQDPLGLEINSSLGSSFKKIKKKTLKKTQKKS